MSGEILGSHCLIYSHPSSDITSLLLIFHIVSIPSKQSHYLFLFSFCVIDHSAQRIVIVFRNTRSFFIGVPSEQAAQMCLTNTYNNKSR